MVIGDGIFLMNDILSGSGRIPFSEYIVSKNETSGTPM